MAGNVVLRVVVYLSDITHLTALLLPEGRKYRFIHRSVQEFHSARFIKELPDSLAKKVYTEFLQPHWQDWYVEIEFLREIDFYRWLEFFARSDLESLLKLTSDELVSGEWHATQSRIKFLTSLLRVQLGHGLIVEACRATKRTSSWYISRADTLSLNFARHIHGAQLDVVPKEVKEDLPRDYVWSDPITGSWWVGLDSIYIQGGIQEKVENWVVACLAEMADALRKYERHFNAKKELLDQYEEVFGSRST